jgi:hypothetical protein
MQDRRLAAAVARIVDHSHAAAPSDDWPLWDCPCRPSSRHANPNLDEICARYVQCYGIKGSTDRAFGTSTHPARYALCASHSNFESGLAEKSLVH